MYYRLDEQGGIIDYSASKYHEDCIFTANDIIVAWDGNAYVAGTEPAEPEALVKARIQEALTSAVQARLDTMARGYGYDDCHSACTYVDTGVAKFDAEGRAFRKWRSSVWAKCYEVLAEVNAGERAIPSEDTLLGELPELFVKYE